MDMLLITGALLILLIPSVISDVRYYRIPNRLVFPFWFIGPALYLLLYGGSGLQESLSGLGVALGMALPFWLLGWFGAGDVKLLAAAGSLTGYALIWPILGTVAILGAVLALFALLIKGALGQTLQRYSASLTFTLSQKKLVYLQAQGKEANVRLPYAIAISTGVLAVWCYHLYTSGLFKDLLQ